MSAGRIHATYRVRCAADAIEARAQALAVEQSIEMPLAAVRDAWIRDTIVGRVEAIAPEGADVDVDAPRRAPEQAWRVDISLAAATVDGEPGQLMNMLFGNSSLQPDVELLDAQLPPTLLDALPGPAFGIPGLRGLVGAPTRPLTCTALKPQGLPTARLAQLAELFARAGIDVIKDDHGIADQACAPFAQRVPAIQAAVARANRETGGATLYAPSLSGGPSKLAGQLRVARDAGVRCVLACPMLIGVATFVDLVRSHGDLVILAHPALAGAPRIAAPLLLGRLFRIFGADATIFPNFGGRFSYDRDTCLAIAGAARDPLGGHRATLPVPAGGMSVARVDEMIETFGCDTMLLIGGNLLEAGDAMPQRASEFVARVHRFALSPGEGAPINACAVDAARRPQP